MIILLFLCPKQGVKRLTKLLEVNVTNGNRKKEVYAGTGQRSVRES